MILQTRTAARTKRIKQIVQFAIEDHKTGLEQGRHDQTLMGGTFQVAPLVVTLQYYKSVLDAIEQDQLTDAKFQEIRARSKKLCELTQSEA
jgi:histone acetyltransferase (RNA polymerase elongator complex component)